MRIEKGVRRGAPLQIDVDGLLVQCFPGETVATAMLAGGLLRFRTDQRGQERGLYCNMGSCGECFVRVGERRLRACLTPVSEGLKVNTHDWKL